jgi:hypothetical protein
MNRTTVVVLAVGGGLAAFALPAHPGGGPPGDLQ